MQYCQSLKSCSWQLIKLGILRWNEITFFFAWQRLLVWSQRLPDDGQSSDQMQRLLLFNPNTTIKDCSNFRHFENGQYPVFQEVWPWKTCPRTIQCLGCWWWARLSFYLWWFCYNLMKGNFIISMTFKLQSQFGSKFEYLDILFEGDNTWTQFIFIAFNFF